MKPKKITTVVLILVLALQLLPVKQVIQYFFSNTAATEEFADVNKGATKVFKFFEEDNKFLHESHLFEQLTFNNSLFHPYDEKIPLTHAAEIQTPPPNQA